MSEDTETRYFGRCRCCLNYGCLKYMWSEHVCDGEVEIYGAMLVECFALCFEQSEDTTEDDQICESCITKLRDANNFKKAVLEAQEDMMQQIEKEETVVKVERDIDHSETDGVMVIYKGSGDEQDPSEDQLSDDGQALDVEKMEYEEVEFLEEDEPKVVVNEDTDGLIVSVPAEAGASQSITTEKAPKKKCKWPKKLPKNERYKTYKQYTSEDLKKCLDAVTNGEMTPLEASEVFNIPKKTILAKARMLKNAQKDSKNKKMGNLKANTKSLRNTKTVAEPKKLPKTIAEEIEALNIKPVESMDGAKVRAIYKAIVYGRSNDNREIVLHGQNIKAILECSNATMVKSHYTNGYDCFFCDERRLNPAELKKHNLEAHSEPGEDPIKGKYTMFNLLIKLDVTDLKCNLCNTNFDKLDNLMAHLEIVHSKIIHTHLKNYIIAFQFDGDALTCVDCGEQFNDLKLLASHVGKHYGNIKCSQCDQAFINKKCLNVHIKQHTDELLKCPYCPKILDTVVNRNTHKESHFSSTNCNLCDLTFASEALLKYHRKTVHDKTVGFVFEACDQAFNAESSQERHSVNRPHRCEYCHKTFFDRGTLRSHIITHNKSKQCITCGKFYASLYQLKKHARTHLNMKKFKCDDCELAFVQKKSLKKHLKIIHQKNLD